MNNQKLVLGIPKGSFQEYTLKIFQEAGFNIDVPKRGYHVAIDDPEIDCFLLRPQEIPRYAAAGKLDLGISGDDWIASTKTSGKVIEVSDLKYSKTGIQRKVTWVLAVPQNSPMQSVKDLQGKTISTEVIALAKQYLAKHKVKAKLEFSWGATEGKPPRFADAIIDITETGSSIKANNLRIIDTVFQSSTKLIASPLAWKNPQKREKIKNIALLLDGAVKGDVMVNLFFHAPRRILKKALKISPRLKSPTINRMIGTPLLDVAICCPADRTRELIPKLKRMGAKDIVEIPLIKLIP